MRFFLTKKITPQIFFWLLSTPQTGLNQFLTSCEVEYNLGGFAKIQSHNAKKISIKNKEELSLNLGYKNIKYASHIISSKA